MVAHDFPLVATARAGFAKEPAALRFAGGGNGRSATIATTGKHHQNFQSPRQITQVPSSRFVMACAVMASPNRFFRSTSH